MNYTHSHVFFHANRQTYTSLVHAYTHVHLLHVDLCTHSRAHTSKLQIHWWRVYIIHDTETQLHTPTWLAWLLSTSGALGGPTSIQPCPPHHGNKVWPPPTPPPYLKSWIDQWISQLAILNILVPSLPQTDFSFAWDCPESSSNLPSPRPLTEKKHHLLPPPLLLCDHIKS